ncbi:MAG: imidazole glycerol phosphate synthase subunit HisH [Calditrichaceae bacterium]|nr:imidazole glycerol phosphate synthase subunit HisH [Calditrichaceae bacterium]MBN2710263.1 imidazole glycerol phosphate synthase subunit HisH [Calditrichaceae bacterium]RQV93884.1 MAG: imidazole glycerol phosphate synthase subunit HisH [Calditrichota bacterium]
MIAIIDYGMGNLRSVQKAFERLKIPAFITSDKSEIKRADKIILPGVGNFRHGMENLKSMSLYEILNYKVLEEDTPILGICLGMQLLTNYSEEGDCAGFGWIDAKTKAICFENDDIKLKIPHMGWNTLIPIKKHMLFEGHDPEQSFYFVHSFCVQCISDYCLAKTEYGIAFASVINKGHIFGMQFHPEKSHKQGLNLLKNFAEYKNV